MSSFFPLSRVRMALFRPFRLVWSLHEGQRCHLHPTSTYWETAVTASGQTHAIASQISTSAPTMPALKEGFYFTQRRASGNTGSHWLPVCWRRNTLMLIWGLHLCIRTLWVFVWLWASLICWQENHSDVSCEEHLTVTNPGYIRLSSDHVCIISTCRPRIKAENPTDTHRRRSKSHKYRPEDQEQLFTHQTGIKHLETPQNTHSTTYWAPRDPFSLLRRFNKKRNPYKTVCVIFSPFILQ